MSRGMKMMWWCPLYRKPAQAPRQRRRTESRQAPPTHTLTVLRESGFYCSDWHMKAFSKFIVSACVSCMVYQYRSGILLSILSSSLYVTYVCWEKSVKGEKRNVKDCNSGNDSLYIYSYTLICLEDLLLVETARCIYIWYMYIP